MLESGKVYDISEIGNAAYRQKVFIWQEGQHDDYRVSFCVVDQQLDFDDFLREFTHSDDNFKPLACMVIDSSFVPVPVETIKHWGRPKGSMI